MDFFTSDAISSASISVRDHEPLQIIGRQAMVLAKPLTTNLRASVFQSKKITADALG